MSIANKQLELMGRYMAELGLSPSARARLQVPGRANTFNGPVEIKLVSVVRGDDGEERTITTTPKYPDEQLIDHKPNLGNRRN